VAVLVLAGAGIAGADSLGDPRQGVGTSGPGSPSCSVFSYAAGGSGAIPAGTDCEEGAKTFEIQLFSPGTAPLSVYSPLLESPTVDTKNPFINAWADGLLATTDLVWSESCGATTIGGEAAQECTLTAPKIDNANDLFVLGVLSAVGLLNDGDCERDDTILFVPKGCDLDFTTGALGTLPGDSPDELFSANENLESTANGTAPTPFPVPEPASLAIMLVGLGGVTGLRRRFAR